MPKKQISLFTTRWFFLGAEEQITIMTLIFFRLVDRRSKGVAFSGLESFQKRDNNIASLTGRQQVIRLYSFVIADTEWKVEVSTFLMRKSMADFSLSCSKNSLSSFHSALERICLDETDQAAHNQYFEHHEKFRSLRSNATVILFAASLLTDDF